MGVIHIYYTENAFAGANATFFFLDIVAQKCTIRTTLPFVILLSLFWSCVWSWLNATDKTVKAFI